MGASRAGSMKLLQDRMGRRDITVHGFRATFKTWASHETGFANVEKPTQLTQGEHRLRPGEGRLGETEVHAVSMACRTTVGSHT